MADDLMMTIDGAIKEDVDAWAKVVGAAIDKVKPPQPADGSNDAMVYAVAAAAGNMIWAATCMLAPEFAVPIRILSFGGAGLASVAGILAAIPPGQTPPGPMSSLNEAMKRAVDEARKRFLSEDNRSKLKIGLHRWIEQNHPAWLKKPGENMGNVRKMVWEHLFRSPYGAKGVGYSVDTAADLLGAKIRKSLTDFYAMVEEQFTKFKRAVDDEAVKKFPYSGRASPRGTFDPNKYAREKYIKEGATPAKFNEWLNSGQNTDYKSKMQEFKSQHMILNV